MTDGENTKGDPLATLFARRRLMGAALLITVVTTLVLFFDVAFLGKTVQSWPWIHGAHDPREATAGFDHLQDAWAGFLIEGPGVEITKEAFDAGRLPLWNAGEACGAPHWADGEHAAFSVIQYPLHRWGLGAWDVFALYRMGLACFLAMLLVLAFEGSLAAAWLVGAAFGFGPNFVLHANLVHLNVTALLPLVFLATAAFAHRPNLRRWLFAALVYGAALNGGNPQPLVAAAVPLLLLALLDARPGSSFGKRLGAGLALGAAGVFGALLTAASLLPMAELLGGPALSRAVFDHDAPACLSTLTAFLSPIDRTMAAPTGALDLTQGPANWAMGPVPALAAVVACVMALFGRSRRGLALAWSLVLGLGFLVVPWLNDWVAGRAPVFRDVNWFKYVGALQLVALLLAARLVDSRRRLAPLAAAIAAAALGAHLIWGAGEPFLGRPLIVLIAAVVFVACWLAQPRESALTLGILIVGWMGGLLWLRPNLPDRPSTPLPKLPAVMRTLHDLEKEAERATGQPWRTTAMGALTPPLLSSVLGWRDVRSVSPLPIARYHTLMAPWVNPGIWPPYLLLPASRQFLLSPVLDLLGVRWVLLRDAVLLTRDPERQTEPTPVTVFGELLRSMEPGSLQVEGLLELNAQRGRCRLAPGGRFAMISRARAARVHIAVRLEAAKDSTLHLEIDGREQGIGPGETAVFDVVPTSPTFPIRLRLDSTGPGVILFEDWEVQRFLPKTVADYRFDPAWVDPDQGLLLIENKKALPPVRILRKVRAQKAVALPPGFAATGEGWKPREELLLHVTPEEATSLLAIPTDAPAPDPKEVVSVHRDRPEHMHIELDTLAPSWLQIAEVQDGHWRALLDGRPTRIYPADVAFQAIPVPTAGRHTLELVYDPWPVRWGLRVTFGALALWIALLLFSLFRRGLPSSRWALRSRTRPNDRGDV